MPQVGDRLENCFRAVFPVLEREQLRRASLGVTASWDSISSVNLIAVIEEEFDVQIPIDDYEQMTSFEQIHAYLERRRGA